VSNAAEALVVYAPGSAVQIGGELEAVVLSVQVKAAAGVLYEVAWWSDGARKVEWVYEFEVRDQGEAPRIGVGFRPQTYE